MTVAVLKQTREGAGYAAVPLQSIMYTDGAARGRSERQQSDRSSSTSFWVSFPVKTIQKNY